MAVDHVDHVGRYQSESPPSPYKSSSPGHRAARTAHQPCDARIKIARFAAAGKSGRAPAM